MDDGVSVGVAETVVLVTWYEVMFGWTVVEVTVASGQDGLVGLHLVMVRVRVVVLVEVVVGSWATTAATRRATTLKNRILNVVCV